jgi:hypothetical protein
MPTPIFATRLIPRFLAQFNTSGSVVTQTSNRNRCGGDSVERGSLDLNSFWKKGSSNNGIISSTLLIGTHVLTHAGPKSLQSTETGLFFVGWPSRGSRRRLIHMYIIITQVAEGRIVARHYQMAFRMLCSKTQKLLTLSTSK